MANKTSKKQIIDKIMEQHRRELEACWDSAEGKVVEGSGQDIHKFVDGLQKLCGSFGQSTLKAYLEERDEQHYAKKKRKPRKS